MLQKRGEPFHQAPRELRTTRQTSAPLNPKSQAPDPRTADRKLYLDDLNQSFGSYPLNQMDNTNTHIYEMQSHNRRNAQMRQMGSWFGDVDLAVDDFRDTVSRKLDQLSMSLQRPKVPVPGFGAGMQLPLAVQQPLQILTISPGVNSQQQQYVATSMDTAQGSGFNSVALPNQPQQNSSVGTEGAAQGTRQQLLRK